MSIIFLHSALKLVSLVMLLSNITSFFINMLNWLQVNEAVTTRHVYLLLVSQVRANKFNCNRAPA